MGAYCSVVSDSATPWTVALQTSQSMEFSRQEYWPGLPFPSPGDLPNPGAEPGSPALLTDSLLCECVLWVGVKGLELERFELETWLDCDTCFP